MPVFAQIFGSEPDICAEGARRALDLSGACGIDVNMGCPMPKITGNGEGSALMRDPALAQRVLRAVRDAVDCTVSVKFRAGWDEQSINAVEFARMAEQAGVDFICVHGRTRSQFYGGESDRAVIRAVKQAVTLPVIASGDALTAQSCADILVETGCDAVMIARGAQGNPFLFAGALACLRGQIVQGISPGELLDMLVVQAALACEQKSEARAMPQMRQHALW